MSTSTLLRDAVARALDAAVTPAVLSAAAGQFPAALWQAGVDLGVDRVAVPADAGGSEADWPEVGAVLRVLGATLAPAPFAEAIVARALLARLGQAQPDGIVSIAPTAVTAIAEPQLAAVPWGRAADWVLAERRVARGAAQLWRVPGRTLQWSPGTNLADEPRDTATVPAAVEPAWVLVPPGTLRALGALARATQIAGAGARVLALAVAHVGSREQFGRPLAAFQVVAHSLARLAEAVAALDAITQAAWQALATAGLPGAKRGGRGDSWLYVAAAKIAASDRVDELAGLGHQLHGAMGFTAEYPLQFATRRLWSWRAEFGTAAEWAGMLGARALARGGDRLWQDITTVSDP